jgi:hypothetical protein
MTSLRYIAFLIVAVVLAACSGKKEFDKSFAVSPDDVDLAGIRFSLGKEALENQYPSVRCRSGEEGVITCTLTPAGDQRESQFPGVDEIKLTFFRDTLHTIRVSYGQMFDVEYKNFVSDVRKKYAYRTEDGDLDTVGMIWKYDILKVELTPNPKKHWTGSLMVYTPVLEFQQIAVYKRWLEALEQSKSKTIY